MHGLLARGDPRGVKTDRRPILGRVGQRPDLVQRLGGAHAIGLIAALAISSSVVDCSPFSTNGALIVANSDEADRELVFKRLMQWGMSIVVVAPIVTWAVLVLPSA